MWRVVDTGPLDFEVSTKAFCNLKVPVTQRIEYQFPEKDEEEGRWPGFEQTRVASWHIRTLPHHIPSKFEQAYPYSHQNMVGKQPTWKLTLDALIPQQVLGFRVTQGFIVYNVGLNRGVFLTFWEATWHQFVAYMATHPFGRRELNPLFYSLIIHLDFHQHMDVSITSFGPSKEHLKLQTSKCLDL